MMAKPKPGNAYEKISMLQAAIFRDTLVYGYSSTTSNQQVGGSDPSSVTNFCEKLPKQNFSATVWLY